MREAEVVREARQVGRVRHLDERAGQAKAHEIAVQRDAFKTLELSRDVHGGQPGRIGDVLQAQPAGEMRRQKFLDPPQHADGRGGWRGEVAGDERAAHGAVIRSSPCPPSIGRLTR